MNNDPLGAADEQARQQWEDGDGATVATSSGIWHAAIAYERARLAKPPTPPGTRPTPRTDAELARLLLDFDLTNIDRREAMADFARLLESELAKVGEDFAKVCRTNSENADAMIALVQANGEQRDKIEAQARHNRELQAVLAMPCAPQPETVTAADSIDLPCTDADLDRWNEAAKKAGYINLRAWVIDTLTKAATPHA